MIPNFELELSTDNSSFDDPVAEFGAIFTRVVQKIRAMEINPGDWNAILDSNGATVGRWRWAP